MSIGKFYNARLGESDNTTKAFKGLEQDVHTDRLAASEGYITCQDWVVYHPSTLRFMARSEKASRARNLSENG